MTLNGTKTMNADARYTIAVEGPPATGKSWFLSSVADAVGADRTLALITKPHEANSFGYTSRGIKSELFFDFGWKPSLGRHEADGFLRLLRRLDELHSDDQYDAILLDTYTDVGRLIAHSLLGPSKSATPRDAPDSRSYYGALGYKFEEFTTALVLLQFAKRPKHVLVSVHVKKAEEDENKGILYEGDVLPNIEGRFKGLFGAEFNLVLFSDIEHKTQIVGGKPQKSTSYVLQVQPDNERHAKCSLAPMLKEKTIANDFGTLLGALNGHK